MKCRICKENTLVEYLDLGKHPPSDAFLDNVCDGEQFFPLAVLYCPSCSLSQLSHVVDGLYNDDYPYETRINIQGGKHFRALAYTWGTPRLFRCMVTRTEDSKFLPTATTPTSIDPTS